MPTPESQEMQMRIDELIAATQQGSFQWKAINPTTFMWDKVKPGAVGARMILQRTEQNVVQVAGPGRPPIMVRKPLFNLQVIEMQANGGALPRVAISGMNEPELNSKLQQLFDLASSGFSQQGLDFLKEIISEA